MPSGTQKEIRGAAARLTLSAGITPASGACQVNGSVAGWPSGVGGIAFVIAIDPGLPIMEKILCATLAGAAPATITFITRGYDGTTAQQHDANAIVAHGLDADTQMNFMAHIYDETRDDHEQYVPVDGSRGFDAITSALADVPVSLGTANAEGDSLKLSRANHVHKIGAAAINDKAMFAATGTTGLRIPFVGTSAPASPSLFDIWIHPTTGAMKLYYGPTTGWQQAWNEPWGQVPSGYAQTTTPQNGIGDAGAVDITGLTVTITAVAGRLHKVTWHEPHVTGAGTSDEFDLRLMLDGVVIEQDVWSTAVSNDQSRGVTVLARATPTAGSRTYKANAVRTVGGGGMQMTRQSAPANQPGFLMVEDVGPAADPALV